MIKYLLFSFPFFFSYITHAQTEEAKKHLEQLSIQWMDAWLKKDIPFLQKTLAPDYRLLATIDGQPVHVSRKQWLEILPVYIAESFKYRDFDIRIYGNTAIVQSQIDIKATLNGHDRSGTFQLTDVWNKNEKGDWQVVHRHSTYYPLKK